MQHQANNPLVRVAVAMLSSKWHRNCRNQRAENRWFLAYTLIKNPSLVQYRVHARKICEMTDDDEAPSSGSVNESDTISEIEITSEKKEVELTGTSLGSVDVLSEKINVMPSKQKSFPETIKRGGPANQTPSPGRRKSEHTSPARSSIPSTGSRVGMAVSVSSVGSTPPTVVPIPGGAKQTASTVRMGQAPAPSRARVKGDSKGRKLGGGYQVVTPGSREVQSIDYSQLDDGDGYDRYAGHVGDHNYVGHGRSVNESSSTAGYATSTSGSGQVHRTQESLRRTALSRPVAGATL